MLKSQQRAPVDYLDRVEVLQNGGIVVSAKRQCHDGNGEERHRSGVLFRKDKYDKLIAEEEEKEENGKDNPTQQRAGKIQQRQAGFRRFLAARHLLQQSIADST